MKAELIVVPEEGRSSQVVLNLPPDYEERLVETGPKEDKLPGYTVSKSQHLFLVRCAKSSPDLRFRTFVLPEGERYAYEKGKKPLKKLVRKTKVTNKRKTIKSLREKIAKVERQLH